MQIRVSRNTIRHRRWIWWYRNCWLLSNQLLVVSLKHVAWASVLWPPRRACRTCYPNSVNDRQRRPSDTLITSAPKTSSPSTPPTKASKSSTKAPNTPAKKSSSKIPLIVLRDHAAWPKLHLRISFFKINWTKANLDNSLQFFPATENDFKSAANFLDSSKTPYRIDRIPSEKLMNTVIKSIAVAWSTKLVTEKLCICGYTQGKVTRITQPR